MINKFIHSLIVSLALAAVVPAGAQTVGVTSATSGGPRGKPPAQAERVLQVGVDVKASELVTTGASDRAHLLFLDGSSLSVGPQARLTIDRFVYDPGTKSGEIAISASQGVFRFVGGKISKTTPVSIATPSGTLTIRGGIMLVRVEAGRTVATFLYGVEMTVRANGQTQTVKRPGWQVTVLGGQAPSVPAQAPAGSLAPELGQLEGQRPQPGSGNAEQAMQRSGFPEQNSGRGVPRAGAGGIELLDGGAAVNAVSESGAQQQKQEIKPPQPLPGQRGN